MDYLPNLPYGSTCEVLGLGFGTTVGLSLNKLELVPLGQLGNEPLRSPQQYKSKPHISKLRFRSESSLDVSR